MKNINLYLLLVLALAARALTSCDDDEEGALPQLCRMTAAEFARTVDGKGWQYVESHELKSNGKYSRHDYWEGLIGGTPAQYAFGGDTLTTYMYIDAYPLNGYRSVKYTFDEATNRVMHGDAEVMRVLSATEDELRIVRREATTADGAAVYVYAVYRAMTPAELASLKAAHPYNLDSLNEEFPLLPEQQRFTADDFKACAVGQGWKCAEAHAVRMNGRYDAAMFYGGGTRLKPVDYYISADSLTRFTADPDTGEATASTAPYAYRANGFYVEAEGTMEFRILSLGKDEMHMLREQSDGGTGRAVLLYCVYRRTDACVEAPAQRDGGTQTATAGTQRHAALPGA